MLPARTTLLGAGLAATAAGLALVGVTAAAAPAPPHVTTATLVATVSGPDHPLDAVPDPAGRTIYFTTAGPTGPAILQVPAGGGAVRRVLRGAPLVDPVGLAVSADGRRLFVADPGAGRILVVPVTAGAGRVASLAGSQGTDPHGLEVDSRGSSARVLFTGREPSTGRPGLFSLPTAGAARPTAVATGAPLVAPEGVAVSRTGAIYVSDRGRGGPLAGRVLRLAGGRLTEVARGIRLGNPAGIALTRYETTLLVSSLDPSAGTAQVLLLDTKTLATTTFNSVIGANRAAGGLHRGLRTTVMAWADVSRSGRIYRVDP
jgi:sugar lactone lactonase YvrE